MKKEKQYLMHEDKLWNSEFTLCSDKRIKKRVILKCLKILENSMSIWKNGQKVLQDNEWIISWNIYKLQGKEHSNCLTQKDIYDFTHYLDLNFIDYTGLMKGLALHYIYEYLIREGHTSFYIDFGHDILTFNYPINVEGISLDNGCLFTSGRGHVKGARYNLITVFSPVLNPIQCDYYATKLCTLAEGSDLMKKFEHDYNGKVIYHH